DEVDDVLTYALFPQVGLKFLENRGNPAAFEPVPSADDVAPAASAAKAGEPEVYTVTVNGQSYVVQVSEGGDVTHWRRWAARLRLQRALRHRLLPPVESLCP